MEEMVGLKELRQNLDKYISKIKRGKSLVVLRRSKGLFRIIPLEEEWETVIDFTGFFDRGIRVDELIKRLELLHDMPLKPTAPQAFTNNGENRQGSKKVK